MPNLISPDGVTFRTENPSEIVRLKSRGYAVEGEPVVTVHDTQFHPADHGYREVLDYIAEHPEQANRIIAEEKAGQARISIVGKPAED